MEDEASITRRKFFAEAAWAAAGAGALAGAAPEALARSTARTADRRPAEGTAGTWPSHFDPRSTAPPYPPRRMPEAGEKIHEFEMDLTITPHEIVPGVRVHAFTYNGTLPGPEIRIPEGDWALVNFTNKTPEFHTIHWHGIMLANEMDGVPLGTQWGVGPGQTFRYLFRAQPAGTHFYHCHNMTPLHVQAGMFGSLILESKDDLVRRHFPYERDTTLILSEMDTNLVEDQMDEMIRMMSTMQAMNESRKLMREMSGRMMGWFKDKAAFVNAVASGYVPPYAKARAGLVRPQRPNFFMINGKSYPMTEHLPIRSGENIRVRLINAGMMPHFMHLHGHDFWHVCHDGAPLAAPVRMNTIPVFPGSTADIIIQGTNPGNWHFHDHSDLSTTNNGQFPGGMMTMLMYEDARDAGVKFKEVIQVSS